MKGKLVGGDLDYEIVQFAASYLGVHVEEKWLDAKIAA